MGEIERVVGDRTLETTDLLTGFALVMKRIDTGSPGSWPTTARALLERKPRKVAYRQSAISARGSDSSQHGGPSVFRPGAYFHSREPTRRPVRGWRPNAVPQSLLHPVRDDDFKGLQDLLADRG